VKSCTRSNVISVRPRGALKSKPSARRCSALR
jgi:hypothetical protein